MNRKSAMEKGYCFTGYYGHDREEIKDKRDELRSVGYKAVLVIEKPNPLSRECHGNGYSVYADKKYFIDKRLNELHEKLNSVPQLRIEMHKRHLSEIQSLTDNEIKIKEEIEELQNN